VRRPREHGWTCPDGITHHIYTRQANAYLPITRAASCGRPLNNARRARLDRVDCMACVAVVAGRERLAPRPPPNPRVRSWWMRDGTRHKMSETPWIAACGANLRVSNASSNPINCVGCGATPTAEPPDRRSERGADLGRPRPASRR
jgi:hypothetical protein